VNHKSSTTTQANPQKRKSMPQTKRSYRKLVIALASAFLASATTTPGQPSASVDVSVRLPSVEIVAPAVEIHSESDFYEPLTPQGEWVVVGSYGRCWRPARVARDWRPYCNGNWQRTDAGWYWVSDEPWAWATYHYGRWDFSDHDGWYWVPQTQWAPAWVSWHEGGGYIGWAPLQPSVTISVNGFVGFNESRISPRAFVFVKQGRFLDPIRPASVVVNNTTIIRNTVTIRNTTIVNHNVINEGPATAVIEKASGRKVQPVMVQELRHKEEAVVLAKRGTPSNEKRLQAPAPARGEAQPREPKIVAVRDPLPTQRPGASPQSPSAAAPKIHEPQSDKREPVPAPRELKPEARPENNHPQVNREPIDRKSDQHLENQPRSAPPSEKQPQRPAQERPAPSERSGPSPAEKDHEDKPKP
jgi:hypothetical protein